MLAGVSRCWILIALGLLGCLPDDDTNDVTIPPPPHPELCGNGKCEPSQGENNVNCTNDCPHCYPIAATRSDGSSVIDDACGAPRAGKTPVVVAADQELYLTFGREMVLGYNEQHLDLELVGQVTGAAAAAQDVCPLGAAEGAVQVLASGDDRSWKQIGLWTAGGRNQFSLTCTTQLNSARNVKLHALTGASFTLTAAHALSCLDK
jgi:hypothetical protein